MAVILTLFLVAENTENANNNTNYKYQVCMGEKKREENSIIAKMYYF